MSDLYKHFKGGYYRKMFDATDAASGAPVVVYLAIEDGMLWTRLTSEFNGTVEKDGKTVQRFRPVSHLPGTAFCSCFGPCPDCEDSKPGPEFKVPEKMTLPRIAQPFPPLDIAAICDPADSMKK